MTADEIEGLTPDEIGRLVRRGSAIESMVDFYHQHGLSMTINKRLLDEEVDRLASQPLEGDLDQEILWLLIGSRNAKPIMKKLLEAVGRLEEGQAKNDVRRYAAFLDRYFIQPEFIDEPPPRKIKPSPKATSEVRRAVFKWLNTRPHISAKKLVKELGISRATLYCIIAEQST